MKDSVALHHDASLGTTRMREDDENGSISHRQCVYRELLREKEELEVRKADLLGRKTLAIKRLRAAKLAEGSATDIGACSWLSSPGDIARMRDDLCVASESEEMLIKLVEQVRNVRERVLVQALCIYRDRSPSAETHDARES